MIGIVKEYMMNKNLTKWIFTFGSNQLQEIRHKVRPMKVMIVIQTEHERDARNQIFDSFIGQKFCTSYPYKPFAEEFVSKYNMKVYTLKQIEDMRD